MADDPTVFVVDDDPDIRASLKNLLDAVHLPVVLFQSAEDFLEADRTSSPGCIVLDVRMPGMGGLQLLTHLQSFKAHPPVVMLTGHGDIPMVLRALKSGALDFIEKPANPQRFLEAVNKALAVDRENRAKESELQDFHSLLATLSAREREVFEKMVGGVSNKAIAQDLGISDRTLEKHRDRVMRKMGTRTLADLVRAAVLHGVR